MCIFFWCVRVCTDADVYGRWCVEILVCVGMLVCKDDGVYWCLRVCGCWYV